MKYILVRICFKVTFFWNSWQLIAFEQSRTSTYVWSNWKQWTMNNKDAHNISSKESRATITLTKLLRDLKPMGNAIHQSQWTIATKTTSNSFHQIIIYWKKCWNVMCAVLTRWLGTVVITMRTKKLEPMSSYIMVTFKTNYVIFLNTYLGHFFDHGTSPGPGPVSDRALVAELICATQLWFKCTFSLIFLSKP